MILKCAYSFNQHAIRDTIINQGLSVDECLQYSQKETWKDVVQCKETFNFRVDYIIELKDQLMKNKDNQVTEREVNEIVKDISNFLVG